ncbi:MAG: magnesium transporter [Helicobacteraceae bacterium]|jgi:magnesium transporter|nr:magnesium transporter [Helicobacteraceae bacterium]
MIKYNKQSDKPLQPHPPISQKERFNPTPIAKSLETLVGKRIGLFFAELSKIPTLHLIDVLLLLSKETLYQVLQRISVRKVYEAMSLIPSDDATDFMQQVENIDKEYAKKLQTLMNAHERHEFFELSQYNEHQAGAYMEVEMLTATLDDTIEDVKNAIRLFRKDEPLSYIIKLFVTDRQRHLLATLHFSDLILFDASDTIRQVMQKLQPHHPLSILQTAPIEEVIRLFNEYDLSVLAVVDNDGLLKGRILFDDVYELIQDTHTDQVYKMAGVDDEAEEQSFYSAQRMRLLWLFVNLATILIASFVIESFKETIASYITLAVLLPLVAAIGGNAGMQAMTVTIRRISLGEINLSQARPVLKRESAIVLINGLSIALTVALITYLWFDDAMLSLVIGLAMFINLFVAGSIGALIPLLLKRIGIDPAIASSILLTTTSDIFGFFIFLFLASLILL